jgi:outer membrane lipoprotein SlyB
MKQHTAFACTAIVALALLSFDAAAQMRVQYGRITNVQSVTVTDTTSRAVGTLVGGGIGLATGSGQSGSNRALRGLGGAAAGRAVGTAAGNSQAFEYTVLIDGTQTVRLVSDQAGKRIGDCVAVEQGQFSNIRLVPDARCAPRPAAEGKGWRSSRGSDPATCCAIPSTSRSSAAARGFGSTWPTRP